MSIRIHTLAKELEVPNKELMDFINQRQDKYGLEIKTPSNAIAPLYADIIKADFEAEKAKASTVETENKAADSKKKTPSKEEESKTPVAKTETAEKEAPKENAAPEEEKAEPAAPATAAPAPATSATPPVVAPPPVSNPGKAPVLTPPPLSSSGIKRPAMVPPPAMRARPIPVPPPPAVKDVKSDSATPAKKKQNSTPDVVVRGDFQQSSGSKPAPLVPPSMSRSAPPAIPNLPERKEILPKGDASEEKTTIQIKPPIIVRDFAKAIEIKPFRLISELMDMGIFASMNLAIEESIAIRIAEKHGFILDIKHRGEQQQKHLQKQAEKAAMAKSLQEDIKNYVPRPPIVCILGHVDHGKTTLLDTIRKTNVVAGEAGGITQHTAAYQVEHNSQKITFLDTPGHAAFSKMRERGANITDIAILVVAADDGFMPQTDEALSFAQKAGVPVIVAINKIDSKGANVEKVKQQMQKRGITPEEWGGETLCCGISALKAENIDKLLELVLLQSEIMELKGNPKAILEGIVVESQLEAGRGATSTVIVRAGTMKVGDVILSKGNWCKIRAILDDKGNKIKSALPSTPAIVMGWTGAPDAGDNFIKVENDRVARKSADEYILEEKKRAISDAAPKPTNLQDLMQAIANKDQKVFNCIVKSDVSGTVEALVACLEDIKSDKVKLEVIDWGVGQITKNDVALAATANASIVAFNVKLENGVPGEAKHKGVGIISHNIIYELITQVREAMKELLDPELRENKLGAAEVRQVFSVSKGGKIAGCMVTEGLIKRDKFARVIRGDKDLSGGRVGALKRFKDDAAEVRAGYECGISLTKFSDFEPGDIIECYEILEIRPDL